MMISAARIADTRLINAGKRVDKAVQQIAKAATANSGGPDVKDIIEFKTAGHAFKASAKVAKMANEMQGAILNIKA
jgi:hypothetical protein